MLCYAWVKASILGMLAVKRLRKYMWGQGISRLSYDQILKLYYDDLQALSDFLDEKPYLMGDKLSSSDCLAYPFMEIIHSTLDSSQGNPIKDFMLTLPNLNESFENTEGILSWLGSYCGWAQSQQSIQSIAMKPLLIESAFNSVWTNWIDFGFNFSPKPQGDYGYQSHYWTGVLELHLFLQKTCW